jgi:MFS family permease
MTVRPIRIAGPLSRFNFILIYLLLMLSAISIGIMISLLPLVARTAHISDILIVSAQAITAGSWMFVASAWARLAKRRGRKFVIMIGGIGLSLGCFATGGVIWVAVAGLVAPMAALAMLVAARIANGAVGLAVVPAAQAFVVERTPIERRTVVMSSLASAQALGTILGPAAAPFMTHIPGLGLAGPMVIIASLCTLILPVLAISLPHDGPGTVKAQDMEGPVAAAEGVWRMPALRGHLIYSTIMATAAIGLIQTIGFLVLDTVKGPPEGAQFWVGQVIAAGALATLFVQLLVTPLLKPTPRAMMLAAPIISILGLALLCLLPDYWLIMLGTVIANIGFALGRPGVATAASLLLPISRQTELAAAILSTASAGVVIGPVLAVGLYTVWRPLPFMLLVMTQAAAFLIAHRRVRSLQ